MQSTPLNENVKQTEIQLDLQRKFIARDERRACNKLQCESFKKKEMFCVVNECYFPPVLFAVTCI